MIENETSNCLKIELIGQNREFKILLILNSKTYLKTNLPIFVQETSLTIFRARNL